MLSKLELMNFRNFKEACVEFSPGVNVIWGLNGQGKTNLLEAVHVLAFTKSMRTNNEKDLILFGEEFSTVKGDGLELKFPINGRRELFREGVRYTNSREWLGILPVVFFGPQELGIVKNEPGVRRRFMDMAICQTDRKYTRALTDYNRAREQKAKILKGFREKPSLLETLPDFNEKLIQSGEILIKARAAFIEKLSVPAGEYHRDISGGREILEITYINQGDLRSAVEEYRERELAAGITLVGPHRDDIRAKINGNDARVYASQGQAKTAALSLKLAERDLLESSLETQPVMLLDDVLSEMDETRREYILHSHRGGQSLITDCERSRLKELKAGKTIHIRDGGICM